ncbi:MAG: hypothetical protein NZZ60_08795 [Bacteroidia bacterium]|nr:hypothetical protein [Bacteroidia bacterium]MCX7651395.1 hypothetical protein [Bacteroidia bacterium]MDW8416705.1 hypothetical protein [Bacteroidia bacterium]
MRTKVIFIAVLWLGGCALFRDPRANCNHPEHEKYLREQQSSRLAKETRSRGKIGKASRPVRKSCPNP